MHIRYEEQDGKIIFRDNERNPSIEGVVPVKVRQRGKEAVRAYAAKRVSRQREELDRTARNRRTPRSMDFPIALSFNGTTLRGAIVEVDQWNMRMRMDEPIQIMEDFLCSTGVSRIEKDHLNDDGELTDVAIIAACERLIRIYRNALHKRKYVRRIELVRALNREEMYNI